MSQEPIIVPDTTQPATETPSEEKARRERRTFPWRVERRDGSAWVDEPSFGESADLATVERAIREKGTPGNRYRTARIGPSYDLRIALDEVTA